MASNAVNALSRPEAGYKDLYQGCPIPVRALKVLLGKRYMDKQIPEDAKTFWAGDYYPITALDYDGARDVVKLPNGEEVPGFYGFHVFVPAA